MNEPTTASEPGDTSGKQDKAKDTVATAAQAAVTVAVICVSNKQNSTSYITLYNADGPFDPSVSVKVDVTAKDGCVWTPKRYNKKNPKFLHIELTCKKSIKPFHPTGDLTIVVSGAPSPLPVSVVYVDDDTTTTP